MTTLVLVFKKIDSEYKRKYDNFYSSSKAQKYLLNAEIIINESDIDDVFQSICTAIITNIQKSLGKGSSWIIDSVIDHTVSISKYNPLGGSTYTKLPRALDHPRKRLINIQNIDDNECFKWSLVRSLDSADRNSVRTTNVDKEFPKKLAFKDIKFPVKFSNIHKSEKKNFISISFLVLKIMKNVQSMHQKNILKKSTLIYF